MAHFAKVVDNIVKNVIVAEPEFFNTFIDPDGPGEWIQTSYNTYGGIHYNPETGLPSEDQSLALRYNYAGINYYYDKSNDCFYAPKPFDSWTLNTTTYLWDPPVPCPTDDNLYNWNEENQEWDVLDNG